MLTSRVSVYWSSFLYIVCNSSNLINADLPIEKIKKCMGDPEADVENDVLKTEQIVQVIPQYLFSSVITACMKHFQI